jgi:hypothetical protein
MQLGEVTCLYLKCQPGNRPNIGYFMIAPLFEALIGRVKKEPEPEVLFSSLKKNEIYHFMFCLFIRLLHSLLCSDFHFSSSRLVSLFDQQMDIVSN